MKLKRNNKGFSLAEMLVVVAIIVILMGVAFIAVQSHQRSMTRLEFDGIAKEIFVAAQNHLTSAEGQGYLQFTTKQKDDTAEIEAQRIGIKEDSSFGTEDVRYFVYNAVHTYAEPPKSILDLMLPFGSVDDTVRLGGTYIIRYQPSSGTVLDVFYSFPGRSSMLTITGKQLTADDYKDLMERCRGEENIPERNKQVVGWYGGSGAEALPIGKRLESPIVILHNEEILWVEVRDRNELTGGASLRLTVKGDVSGTRLAFDLDTTGTTHNRVYTMSAKDGYNRYAVILDDITTSSMDLWNLTDVNGKHFNPGENLSVEAVAFNNSAITNVAYSGKNTTNSLFTDIETTTTEGNTTYSALIENFRHFENLDKTISGFNEKTAYKSKDDEEVTIASARQITDLNWTGALTDKAFVQRVYHLKDDFIGYPNSSGPNKLSIYDKDASALISDDDKLYPVSPDYVLDYNGGSHKISNVKVEHNSDSGLFGTLTSGSKVKNLELIDFDITSTNGSAGALVGTANGTEITNVVAHNSEDNDSKFDNDDTTAGKKPNVTATGAAGGLIGSMSGGTVTKSAAAVYVKGGTEAGGLIGSAASGTVTACYSGGHTYSGTPTGAAQKYDDTHKDVYPVRYYDADNNPMYNVTATSGAAGGLIGSAGTATISNSYSTCSASGTTAGGFVGSSTGNITNCYCTGLVMKPEDSVANHGAFAGTADMSKLSNCQFFEIINEIKKDENDKEINGYDYLRPLGNVKKSETAGVTAFDASADSYNSFVGAQDAWTEAKPYDTVLEQYYKITKATGEGETQTSEAVCGYNLKSVSRLDSSVSSTDFVATHYGDWPAPEEFIFN